MAPKVKEKTQNLKEAHIPASNCCARGLYNIPPGTLFLLVPGLTLTLIGAALSVVERDSLFENGAIHVGIIITVIGMGLVIGATACCCWASCSERHKTPSKASVSPQHPQAAAQVQLIGIYRISDPDPVIRTSPPQDYVNIQIGSVT